MGEPALGEGGERLADPGEERRRAAGGRGRGLEAAAE